jgi:hypothetical protein
MLKAFLHIGTPKTGTTSIQNFLQKNKKVFLQNGYLVGEILGKGNNRLLPLLAYNHGKMDDMVKVFNLYTKEALDKKQKVLIQKQKLELQNNSKTKNVIFSSEHIYSRLDSNEIKNLYNILKALGFDEVEVIVYLRNPSGLAMSLYSTAVKHGDATNEYPSPPQENQHFKYICDYEQRVKDFEEVFGKENMKVRLFEKEQLLNQSVVDDFFELFDNLKTHKQEFDFNVEEKNTSLNLLGIELLRNLNKSIPRFLDNKHNLYRGNLVEFVEKHFSTSYGGLKYTMPKAIYKEYDNFFEKSNEYIRENYFPNRRVLFKKISYEKINENYKLNGLKQEEFEMIVTFVSDLLFAKNKLINEQKQKILKLQNNKPEKSCFFEKIKKYFRKNKKFDA